MWGSFKCQKTCELWNKQLYYNGEIDEVNIVKLDYQQRKVITNRTPLNNMIVLCNNKSKVNIIKASIAIDTYVLLLPFVL